MRQRIINDSTWLIYRSIVSQNYAVKRFYKDAGRVLLAVAQRLPRS